MKHLFIITAFFVGLLTGNAATYSVQATAIEAMNAEPLAGASYSIYSARDTVTPLLSGVTDADGVVNQQLEAPGQYTLRITYVGLQEARCAFTCSAEVPAARLGAVALLPSGQVLEEVVVTGKRPIIETSGDKVAYNMDEDPASQTNSVLEMLRKVPMVSVDGNDNIYINGQQNFKIYVNGKEDPMLSQNASMVLKNLPASSVVKVEVILEPGAKYDAEGVAGILNIVTVGKKSAEGYLATLTAGITNRHTNVGAYARTKINKVTASVDVGYSNTAIAADVENNATMDRYTSQPDGSESLNSQSIIQKQKNQFISGTLQLSWEPDTLNLFTLSANSFGIWGRTWFNTFTQYFPVATRPDVLWSNRQNMTGDWTWSSLTVNAGYQHNFDMKGHNIVLSYQYVHGWDTQELWQSIEAQEVIDNSLTYDYSDAPTNEHTVQLDYTNPLSSVLLLETGAKGIFRRNSSDGYTLTGSSWDNLIKDNDNTVKLSQYQDVAAVYASLTARYKGWAVKGGLRYEFTHMGVDFHTPGYDNYSSYLNDWVPNGSVSYTIAPAQTLHASYQMRIRRPSVNELNPHRVVIFPGMEQSGNPDLTSEVNHNVALQYSNFAGRVGWNIRASYSFSDNQIDQLFSQEGDMLHCTYINSGSEKVVGLTGYMRYAPSQKFSFSVNAQANYLYYSFTGQNLKNHGWMYGLGGDVNYTMPWAIQANAYGGWQTRAVNVQGWRSGYYYYGLSFSRAFLKGDKLKLTVSTQNFATPTFTFKQYMNTGNSCVFMGMHAKAWSVGLSVSYTLGSMSTDVKRTSTSIQNTDVEVNKKN